MIVVRRVANYEIGCVNANSAMQFEEGPRLGVFDKVKFISKKSQKKKTIKKSQVEVPPQTAWRNLHSHNLFHN